MMQLLVTDSKTQIVRYDNGRADDCIECDACVKCCITGIDIRTSPYQTECIYCGDCIDACSAVLARRGKTGLLAFSWGETDKRDKWYEKLGFVDTRRWIILGLVVVYTIGLALLVRARQPLSISAAGDRSTLYRVEEDDRIYNDYSVRIENRSLRDGLFLIECSLPDGRSGDIQVDCSPNPVFLKSRETQRLRLAVSSKGEAFRPGPNSLVLVLRNTEDSAVRTEIEAVFFMPEKGDELVLPAQESGGPGNQQ